MDNCANSTLASKISIENAVHNRLREITNEAAELIKATPSLNIDHVTVTKDGIFTAKCVSGFTLRDPLLETIRGYRKGVEAFEAVQDTITKDNEDTIVQETYGSWQDKLFVWDQPARSLEGVLETVKFLLEDHAFGDEYGERLAKALIPFLEANCTLRPRSEPDPIIAAIAAYKEGIKAFSAIDEDDWHKYGGGDAVTENTYGRHLRVLDNWSTPCTSFEGATAALRHAVEENESHQGSDSMVAMVRAALAYLEGAR